MTHPERERNEAMRRAWFPDWPRVVDDGRGLTRNFCATLRAAHLVRPEASWAVVAQDDVEPCPGFDDGLHRLLNEAPVDADVIAFFSMGRTRDPRDVAAGNRWRIRRRGELLWIMLVAVRRHLVEDLAAGVEAQRRPADRNGGRHRETGCDERLSLWMDHNHIRAATHLPNLVQHRGEVSVAGHGWTIGGRPRMSPTYTGEPMAVACGWSPR